MVLKVGALRRRSRKSIPHRSGGQAFRAPLIQLPCLEDDSRGRFERTIVTPQRKFQYCPRSGRKSRTHIPWLCYGFAVQYSRQELEAHLAIAILELVRIRRRLNDAKVIDAAERDLMATKIDKAFETSNRFHVVEQQKRTETMFLLSRAIVTSPKFPHLKEEYPRLRFDELEKAVKALEEYFGVSAAT